MTTEQFTYWLQGFMEIANPTTLNEQQVQEIKNHLALTLHKVTPVVNDIRNTNIIPHISELNLEPWKVFC